MPARRTLLVISAILSLLWLTTRPSSNDVQLEHAPFVEDHSLSVILPVIPSTIASLDELLAPFLAPTTILYEVVIVCPHSLVTDIHRKLRVNLSNAAPDHPKMSLYPWSGLTHRHQAFLQVIAQVNTQYILLLDEHGFKGISECNRAYLLHPRALHIPAGPRGFTRSSHHWAQLSPSSRAQPAAFLIPPFIAPSGLLSKALLTSSPSLDWPSVGNYIAKSTLAPFGGIVIGTDIYTVAWNTGTESDMTFPDKESVDVLNSHASSGLGSMSISSRGFFVLAFPRGEDLRDFIPATCKLRHQGYTVLAYIYDPESSGVVVESNCSIPYFEHPKETPSFSDWLISLGSVPDIIVGLDHQDPVSSTFSLMLERPPFLNTTLLRLPRLELPYTEWIGTLTLHELRRSSLSLHRLVFYYF